jgi:hypothetical protein
MAQALYLHDHQATIVRRRRPILIFSGITRAVAEAEGPMANLGSLSLVLLIHTHIPSPLHPFTPSPLRHFTFPPHTHVIRESESSRREGEASKSSALDRMSPPRHYSWLITTLFTRNTHFTCITSKSIMRCLLHFETHACNSRNGSGGALGVTDWRASARQCALSGPLWPHSREGLGFTTSPSPPRHTHARNAWVGILM